MKKQHLRIGPEPLHLLFRSDKMDASLGEQGLEIYFVPSTL